MKIPFKKPYYVINMQIERSCTRIPIELWGIIAQYSNSSTRCIMRCLNSDFKTLIEKIFEKYAYKLSPTELLGNASHSMFEWSIKYAFETDMLRKKRRSTCIYQTLAVENNLERIKQIYDLVKPTFGGKHGIRSIFIKDRLEIITFFAEKRCLSSGAVSLLCQYSAAENNSKILEYLTKSYNLDANDLGIGTKILEEAACKAAFNGNYAILEYILKKNISGVASTDVGISAAKGGHIECLKLADSYGCLEDFEYGYQAVMRYLYDYEYSTESKSKGQDECYQFIKKFFVPETDDFYNSA